MGGGSPGREKGGRGARRAVCRAGGSSSSRRCPSFLARRIHRNCNHTAAEPGPRPGRLLLPSEGAAVRCPTEAGPALPTAHLSPTGSRRPGERTGLREERRGQCLASGSCLVEAVRDGHGLPLLTCPDASLLSPSSLASIMFI